MGTGRMVARSVTKQLARFISPTLAIGVIDLLMHSIVSPREKPPVIAQRLGSVQVPGDQAHVEPQQRSVPSFGHGHHHAASARTSAPGALHVQGR
jgi:hypothetical protein